MFTDCSCSNIESYGISDDRGVGIGRRPLRALGQPTIGGLLMDWVYPHNYRIQYITIKHLRKFNRLFLSVKSWWMRSRKSHQCASCRLGFQDPCDHYSNWVCACLDDWYEDYEDGIQSFPLAAVIHYFHSGWYQYHVQMESLRRDVYWSLGKWLEERDYRSCRERSKPGFLENSTSPIPRSA